ncbi:MAG: PIN domain-containing protein [Dehalococcoidia bacterium]|nr:PIN domain-containing protein [Dehalococcoidia bacterium]
MGGVIVDSSVWSLALRRRNPDAPASREAQDAIANLTAQGQVVLLGPVRQEVLTGIREIAQFERLRAQLAAYPDEPLIARDFERAAEFANTCRAAGVQGSPVDFLLCAVADRADHRILTLDDDFERFEPHIPVPRYGLR